MTQYMDIAFLQMLTTKPYSYPELLFLHIGEFWEDGWNTVTFTLSLLFYTRVWEEPARKQLLWSRWKVTVFCTTVGMWEVRHNLKLELERFSEGFYVRLERKSSSG